METFFGAIGGLGLFVLGMQLMSEGLQRSAGNKLRRILEVMTSNRFIATFTGALLTVLVQSSSTTTVMVVGFVNAGLMNLTQAVGTIFGANVGTTVTAQLISFQAIDAFALPMIAVGVVMHYFVKKRIYRHLGKGLLGFGILLLGMTIMSDSLRVLENYPPFLDMLKTFGQNPLLGMFVGALFTIAVQSSSASTAVIISMTQAGVLELDSALALILGTNIGTCVTAMLAAIGANLTARRAAVSHVIFNLIGALIFLLILPWFTVFIESNWDTVARQTAMAHTIFNIANTILFLPFVSWFVMLITRLVPGEELIIERGIKYIDRRLFKTPSLALGAGEKEVARMGEIAGTMLEDSLNILFKNQKDYLKDVQQREEVVDELEQEIAIYLSELSNKGLSGVDAKRLTMLLHAINDIERIGDHSENVADLCIHKIEDDLPFSDQAREEIQSMFEQVSAITDKAMRAFKENDHQLAREVIKDDDYIDDLEKELRDRHIQRINKGKCYPMSGVVYLDILSNMERIGDHATNIAQVVLGEF
ncbi:Na/Pi cotransporter family protein [Proteinivorax tanatarense]|uniref:Na/Pi cotransporter family protein n=1 Tax=Proteinivorax tanatarense TaxID=1260629 RepID=A0AAU7VKZ9_9FIRM